MKYGCAGVKTEDKIQIIGLVLLFRFRRPPPIKLSHDLLSPPDRIGDDEAPAP